MLARSSERVNSDSQGDASKVETQKNGRILTSANTKRDLFHESVQAQLTASEAARTTLQAQVDRMGRASGERKIGVDARNLGRPSQFNGTDSAWRDWSVVFRSYAALVHPALKEEMQRVERLPTAETKCGSSRT